MRKSYAPGLTMVKRPVPRDHLLPLLPGSLSPVYNPCILSSCGLPHIVLVELGVGKCVSFSNTLTVLQVLFPR